MLFARSIEDNISYGLDRCSVQQVERAARLANAHRFIDDMKDGYKTEAGEKGVQLSGEWLDSRRLAASSCSIELLSFA